MERDETVTSIGVLTDHHEIRQLLLQYFVNVDRRQWLPVKAIFVPRTLVDYSDLMPIPDAVPAEDVVDRIEAAIALYAVTVHQMGNCDITITGDEAQSETWVNAHHVYADPDRNEGRMPIAGLRYQDDWVRTPAGWRVQHRRAFTDWRSWWEPRPPTYVNGTHQ